MVRISLVVVFFCHTAQMKPLLPLSVSQYSLHILVSVTSAAVPSHFCWVLCAFSYLLVGCFFFILVGVHVNPQRHHTDALPEVICIIVV